MSGDQTFDISNAMRLERPVENRDGSMIADAIVATPGVYKYDTLGDGEAAYLPKEELQKATYYETVNGAPLIIQHKDVRPSNYKQVVDGALHTVRWVNGASVGRVRISSDKAISYFNSIPKGSKVGVSLAYNAYFERKSGVFNGEKYTHIQRDLKVNHLAIVDVPNMKEAHIQNTKISEEIKMDKKEIQDTINASMSKYLAEAEAKRAAVENAKKMDEMYNEMKKMYDDMKGKNKKKDDDDDKDKGVKNEAPKTSTSYADVANARASAKKIIGKDLPDNITDTFGAAEYVCNAKGIKAEGKEAFDMLHAFSKIVDETAVENTQKPNNLRTLKLGGSK